MFVNKRLYVSRAHISKSSRCFNVKPSTYYFHMKMKILADFQICISVTLTYLASFSVINKVDFSGGSYKFKVNNRNSRTRH